jgi:hypothetical protein
MPAPINKANLLAMGFTEENTVVAKNAISRENATAPSHANSSLKFFSKNPRISMGTKVDISP